jgi:GNAT superfamily N-acetyltransferase
MSRSFVEELRFRVHAHHRDCGALVAFRSRDGEGVGAARYVRHRHDRESAEVMVAVTDDGLGPGLAAELLRRLAEHARSRGIQRFTVVMPTAQSDVRVWDGWSAAAS